MEEVLKQIKTVPGTLGCMVYDLHGQVVSHVFPSIFDKKVLSATVTIMSQNLPGLMELTGGVRMVDFRFQSGRVVVKPVVGGCLVILCDAGINLLLLLISLNLAIKQIETILATVAPIQQQAAAEPGPTSSVSTASPQDLIEKGPMAVSLQGMQTTLTKFMGPMAQVIFLECVEKWHRAAISG